MWEPVAPPPAHTAAVTSLDFTPDGQTLVSGARDGSVRIWDVRNANPLPPPPSVEKPVTVVRFSPSGRGVLVAAEDGVVRLWDLNENQMSAAVIVHDPGKGVRSAGFNRTGQFVFTASAPPGRDWASVRIWDARTGQPTCPPLPGRVTASSVAFHPDGQVLAVGGWEGNVRLWDPTSGRPVGPPILHNGAVASIAFDATGAHLAVAARDGLFRIWRLPPRLPARRKRSGSGSKP